MTLTDQEVADKLESIKNNLQQRGRLNGHARAVEGAPFVDDGAPPVQSEAEYQTSLEAPVFPFVAPPLTLSAWVERELAEPDCLLGDLLTTTTRFLFVAPTGLGKSMFLISMGMAAAAGNGFLHWEGRRRCNVLYIDGEMSSRLLKQRLVDEIGRRGGDAPTGFHALSHEDIPNFAPLNTPAGQACIERIIQTIGKVDLIIFDSVMCLTVGDMKDEESWQQTLPWIRDLTRRAVGQIWLHHTGHDETRGYGTKTREWQMDTVAVADRNERDDTDVSFEMRFSKARERKPQNRADFQPVRVALVNDRWEHIATEVKHKGRVSPLGLKFLGALHDALTGDDKAGSIAGRRATKLATWKLECEHLGLIDPGEKPDSARNLFNKYRRELIAANRLACNEESVWTV